MLLNKIDKGELPIYKNIKFYAIQRYPGGADLFNELMSRIIDKLVELYHPKIPFSLEVNLTRETAPIDDERIKSVFIECVVESMRLLDWQVITNIQDLEGNEIIHIQKHKGVA